MTHELFLAGALVFAVTASLACAMLVLVLGARREHRLHRRVMLARGETLLSETGRRSQATGLPIRIVARPQTTMPLAPKSCQTRLSNRLKPALPP